MATETVDWLKLENRIRATPINLLEQGVERGQWEAVAAGLTMLTGKIYQIPKDTKQPTFVEREKEPVAEPEPTYTPVPAEPTPIPERKAGHFEQVRRTTDDDEEIEDDEEEDLDDEVEDEDEDEETEEEDDDDDEEGVHRSKKIRNVSSSGKRVNAKGKKNKFVDDGQIAIEDTQFNPKTPLSPQQLRKRRPEYKKIKVVCHKCGTRENVDPMLAPKRIDRSYKMRYVCNECSCIGGSDG